MAAAATRRVKTKGIVQDGRGKRYPVGSEFDLVASFDQDCAIRLTDGTQVTCANSMIELITADFEDKKEEKKEETRKDETHKEEGNSGGVNKYKLFAVNMKEGKRKAVGEFSSMRRAGQHVQELEASKKWEKDHEAFVQGSDKGWHHYADDWGKCDEKMSKDCDGYSDFEATPVITDPSIIKVISDKKLTTKAEYVKSITADKLKAFPEGVDFNAPASLKEANTVMVNGVEHVDRPIPILFKTGNYPDKNFSMSLEEAREALKDFNENVKEVPVTIGHKPTVLDAFNTAKLYKLELKENGDQGTFSARTLLPKWLDTFLQKAGSLGTSARWSKEAKRLVHAALVPNPRIPEASLVAEFDANIPDSATPIMGEGDGPTNPSQEETGEEEPEAMHGKELAALLMEEIERTLGDIDQDPDRHAPQYKAHLAKMASICQKLGAESSRTDEDQDGENDEEEKDQGKNFSDDNVKLKTKIKELEKENDTIRSVAVAVQARDHRKLAPADFYKTLADLFTAAQDDRTHGFADFEGKKISRFQQKIDILNSAPIHPLALNSEDLSPNGKKIITALAGERNADFDKTEKARAEGDRLLALTPLGQMSLKTRAAAAKNANN